MKQESLGASVGSTTPQADRVGWELRPYRPGDERQLVELFARVFRRRISEDHWRWKLKGRPSPVENVWLAVRAGAPIFHYGGIPCRFRLPAGERTAMVSVDVMTAPDARRRGLLTTAGRFVCATWREAAIAFTLGLPNEQWGSRASALGWETLFSLRWLVRPLRPTSLLFGTAARRWHLGGLIDSSWNALCARALRPDPTIDVRPVETAGEAFDRLWHSCAGDFDFSVVRDSAWVGWRYLAAPDPGYRLLLATRSEGPVGYLAYRTKDTGRRRVGLVADLFTGRADAQARRSLISSAIRRMRAEGAEAVLTLAIPGSPLSGELRRAGFVFRRGCFAVQMIPFDAGLPMDRLRDPARWCLAGGDFDVV